MNKTFIRIALAAIVAFHMPAASSAQSNLLNSLKGVASSVAGKTVADKTGSSVLGDVVTKLLGTSKVSESNLVGTWTYSEPCVVAESKNVLSNVAASAAASKGQQYIKQGLTKAGVSAGKMKVEFANDKTVKITVGQKVVNGTYTVSGSDLTVKFNTSNKAVKMNCKLSGQNLQLAMDAKKLLTFINSVAAQAAAANASMSSVSSLLSTVDGLYVGLLFTK